MKTRQDQRRYNQAKKSGTTRRKHGQEQNYTSKTTPNKTKYRLLQKQSHKAQQ